jgi:hypothetical protein
MPFFLTTVPVSGLYSWGVVRKKLARSFWQTAGHGQGGTASRGSCLLNWRRRVSDWIKEKIKKLLGYGVIKSSKEATRGGVWKFFSPFREVSLNRMRCRIMKGVFLETITADASGTSYFINVSLVYWKTLAHLQPESIIGTAESSSRQHGAKKNE